MNAGQDNTMIAIHESALSKIGDVLITLQDETIKRMSDALEAAEARAAQLETDNNEMQSYINEIRVALHTEKDELTIDAVRRVMSERDAAESRTASRSELIDCIIATWEPMVERLLEAEARAVQESERVTDLLETNRERAEVIAALEAERDELARQLAEEQKAINALSQALVAEDVLRRQLNQDQGDLEDYRAAINDLRAKLDQAQREIAAHDKINRALDQALNEGDGVYRP